jgi:hypothetical protein
MTCGTKAVFVAVMLLLGQATIDGAPALGQQQSTYHSTARPNASEGPRFSSSVSDSQQNGPIGSPNGFTQSQIADVSPAGLIIEMPRQPPKQDNDPNFAYYPLTIARTKAYSCMQSSWTPPGGGGCTTVIWDFRCTISACGSQTVNQLENFPVDTEDNVEIRLGFTTVDRAMAATEAAVDWSTNCTPGYTGYLQWTEAVGIPDSHVYMYSDFLSAFDAGQISYYRWTKGNLKYDVPGSGGVPTDIVVMPMAQACSIPSKLNTKVIEIDEERADGPTSSQILTHYQNLSSITANQGYKLNVWADQLEGRNAKDSALTAETIPEIMSMSNFQQFFIKFVSTNKEDDIQKSWDAQITIANGGVMPSECSPVMQHIGIGMELPILTPTDWSNMNQILADWCVPVMEPYFSGAHNQPQSLGGVNCYDGQPVLNPEKWGNGIGIPVSCNDSRSY